MAVQRHCLGPAAVALPRSTERLVPGGLDSVGYHEHTVAGRGDDPVAGALEYYASRGETPMVGGGRGAAWLALDGEVDLDEWRAVFATGGAHHPVSGERLVGCLRPGLELVVSPHKTVAELGVIGRAEDMHLFVDAERDATMAYLDGVVTDRGGRRGPPSAGVHPHRRAHLAGPTPCHHPVGRSPGPRPCARRQCRGHGRRAGWVEGPGHRAVA